MKLHWQTVEDHPFGEHFCIVNDVVLRVRPMDINPHIQMPTWWHCLVEVPDAHYIIAEYKMQGTWQAGASWCEYTYINTFHQQFAVGVALVGIHAERAWHQEPFGTYTYVIPDTARLIVTSSPQIHTSSANILTSSTDIHTSSAEQWLWFVNPLHTEKLPVPLPRSSGKCLTLTEAKRRAVLTYFTWLVDVAIATDANTIINRLEK